MPFTHFHLGPAVLLGLLLWKYLDFPTFVAANVLIDWRAGLVFLGFWPPPRHAWVHTYLGAVLMAVVLGAVMIKLRPRIDGYLEELMFSQGFSNKKILSAAFVGTFLHVFIDAFHHPTMQPFTPLKIKPLYGVFTGPQLQAFCAACMFAAAPVFLWKTSHLDLDLP
ncbi:MAG: hypothetical protein ABEJ93_01605 [Candidatus Nanohalobium sp.]